MAACTQKEKETAPAPLNNGGLMETDVPITSPNASIAINEIAPVIDEYDNWTAGGYWPTEGIFWIDKDGTITDFKDGKSEVIIPARINGVPVKAIGDIVFWEKGLTHVTLPVGLKSIGSRAFAENQLTSITIPEGVLSIGDGAFEGNPLTYVKIPARAFVGYSTFFSTSDDPMVFALGEDIHFQTSIFGELVHYEYFCNNRKAGIYTEMAYTSQKEGIFEFIKTKYGSIITGYSGGKVDELEIPQQLGGMAVKGVIHGTFYKNDISHVQFPDRLTFIGGVNSFSSNKLTSITIPDSVIYIGDYAFSDNQLDSVDIGKNVSSINKGAFFNNSLTNITIPDSVTYIGDGAFEGNQLTSVTIPNGVTSIGINVFLNNQLTVVVIPDSVTSIASGAFYNNQLSRITISGNVELTRSSRGSFTQGFDDFYNRNKRRSGTYAYSDNQWSLAVPAFVTDEKDFTTDGKGTITRYNGQDTLVVIPVSIGSVRVDAIGRYAFTEKKLASVTIPDSVISIGGYAFGFNQIISVTIPDSAAFIGEYAFYQNKLANITIPGSVKSIDPFAFTENRLTNVTILDGVISIGNYAFMANQITNVTIPDSVTSIGFGAFANNKLTSVVIPDSITSISESAFNHNQLTSVSIPVSVNLIEAAAFSHNPLTSITIGAGVELEYPSFDDGFDNFYETNGKKAGTYVLNNGQWSMK
jgi:hypothetical protein